MTWRDDLKSLDYNDDHEEEEEKGGGVNDRGEDKRDLIADNVSTHTIAHSGHESDEEIEWET